MSYQFSHFVLIERAHRFTFPVCGSKLIYMTLKLGNMMGQVKIICS